MDEEIGFPVVGKPDYDPFDCEARAAVLEEAAEHLKRDWTSDPRGRGAGRWGDLKLHREV